MARILISLVLALLVLQCQQGNDYLLVIDTSGSMAFDVDSEGVPGAGGTLNLIQSDIQDFVKKMNKGDSLTLITFDDTVHRGPRILIQKDADREAVIHQVQQLEAQGRYTDMGSMLSMLKAISSSQKEQGRQQYIIVMSDGKDDPPPAAAKRQPLELRDYSESPQGVNPAIPYVDRSYVYYVSLGKMQDPELVDALSEITDQEVQVVQPGNTAANDSSGDPSDAGSQNGAGSGLTDVHSKIEKNDLAARLRYWSLWIVAVIAGILLFLLLWWLWSLFRNRHTPQGSLVYYDETMGPNMKETRELDKLSRARFSIGSKSGVDVKIRDLGIKSLFLRAGRQEGRNVLLVWDKKNVGLFQFRKQARQGMISSGDEFKLGNCIIKYVDGADE
ncbi:MAG: VWA domain-containing protein [Leptospiraceae bacterium]|nr:VWA domain-containing protein [Leptospiraceae bacterium]